MNELLDNPILWRELRMLGRVHKSNGVRLTLLVLLILCTLLIYYFFFRMTLAYQNDTDSIWYLVVWIQFLIIFFIGPAYGANSIAKEREQQTWDMLTLTSLRPIEIVVGKLLPRVAILSLPIFLLMPVALYAAIQSSKITYWQFIGADFFALFADFCFVSWSLYLSWKLKRTLYAQLAGYTLVVALLTIGTFVITSILSISSSDENLYNYSPFLWVNPIMLFLRFTTNLSHGDTGSFYSPIYEFTGVGLYLIAALFALAFMTVHLRDRSEKG